MEYSYSKNVMERFCLEQKTAVVTGGAGNIGSHSAEAFAQAGASVAVIDLPECLGRSEDVAGKLTEEYGVKAAGYGCDLTDDKAVEDLFDQISHDFGSVDIVHNNAGVGGCLVPDIEPWDSEHDMPHIRHFRQVIENNLMSIYIVAVTAARKMIQEQHGGSIINTASLNAHVVNMGTIFETMDDSSYSVSKAGVLQFTKHFASQVAKYKIRVNSISPGYCYSPALYTGLTPEILDMYNQSQPAKRMMLVEELQGAILYLASDASSYCHGTDILIDGGHVIW